MKHGIIEPSNLPQRFARIYTFLTTTYRNLAQLQIDRFQNLKCDLMISNGPPCQVFSIEMWPISRASNVLLKACTFE
jgi:hypothetical protein